MYLKNIWYISSYLKFFSDNCPVGRFMIMHTFSFLYKIWHVQCLNRSSKCFKECHIYCHVLFLKEKKISFWGMLRMPNVCKVKFYIFRNTTTSFIVKIRSVQLIVLYVKYISRKLYILWEKELIEARRAENSSFSRRMYSLRPVSYLEHYFLCVNIG